MGLFSADIKTLDDLFVHQLQDIYYAENQIVKALPKMIAKASDPQLKRGFEKHLAETRNHVQRLSGDIDDKSVLDAGLVASAQAVEHYEITRYGTLIAWAKRLGRNDCASVLEQTLQEEKATDEALTHIAESQVNRRAA